MSIEQSVQNRVEEPRPPLGTAGWAARGNSIHYSTYTTIQSYTAFMGGYTVHYITYTTIQSYIAFMGEYTVHYITYTTIQSYIAFMGEYNYVSLNTHYMYIHHMYTH